MPEGIQFQTAKNVLTVDEIGDICKSLGHLGVDEIRVTGGEPTIRVGFDLIMTRLAKSVWKKFGLTTNGLLVLKKLPLLWDVGCHHLNISLDSLDAGTFKAITRSSDFSIVRAAIIKARAMGFAVKVNAIIFRGINDHELPEFLKFSADEMIRNVRLKADLIPTESPEDSTSFGFRTANGARLGFIASESTPFCGSCSRWRLSATGYSGHVYLRILAWSQEAETVWTIPKFYVRLCR